MNDEKYAQIQYDENDLENVTVTEVRNLSEGKGGSEDIVLGKEDDSEDMVLENLKEMFENVQEMVKEEKEPESIYSNIERTPPEETFQKSKPPMGEGEDTRGYAYFGRPGGGSSQGEKVPAKGEEAPAKREKVPAKGEEAPAKREEVPAKEEEAPAKGEEVLAKEEEAPAKREEVPAKEEKVPEKGGEFPAKEEGIPAREEPLKPGSAEEKASPREKGAQGTGDAQQGREAVPKQDGEQEAENPPQGKEGLPQDGVSPNAASQDGEAAPEKESAPVKEGAPEKGSIQDERIGRIEECLESVLGSIRRLDKKFEKEILNSETRDNTVKTIYKELNEYKAGLVEKAMKEVLYDFIDIREMMLSRAKHLQKEGKGDMIPLEEFLSYAEDLGDILEKHDVTIYKGEPGIRNVATRQKIVRKAETEDESLVKTVAESLSYGYEYNGKVIYPEKISIFVKKK